MYDVPNERLLFFFRQSICSDIRFKLSLQTVFEGTGKTLPSFDNPAYFSIIIFGMSNSITLDDVAVFFLRTIIH